MRWPRDPGLLVFLVSSLASFAILVWIWSIMPHGLGGGMDGRMISGIARMVADNGVLSSPINLNPLQSAYNIAYPLGLMFTSTWPYAFFDHDTARYIASAISVLIYVLGIVALARSIGIGWVAMPIIVAVPAALQVYPFEFENGASALFRIAPGSFVVIGLFTFILALLIRCGGSMRSLLGTYLCIAVLTVWAIAAEPLWAGLFAIGFAPLGVAVLLAKRSGFFLHGALLLALVGLLWLLGPLEYLYVTLVANSRTMLNDEMGRELGSVFGASAILFSREALYLHTITLLGLISGCFLRSPIRLTFIFSVFAYCALYIVALYYLVVARTWSLPLPVYIETCTFHFFSTFALAAILRHAAAAISPLERFYVRWRPTASLPLTVVVASVVPLYLLYYGFAFAPGNRDLLKDNRTWDEATNVIARVARQQSIGGNSSGSVAVLNRGPGNSRLRAALWIEGVRTLNEYSQTIAPAADILASRLAFYSSDPWLNWLRVTHYNANLFAAFGVEYVLSPAEITAANLRKIATLPDAEGEIAHFYRIDSYESPFTPHQVRKVMTLNAAIDALADERTDLRETALVGDGVSGPIVAAEQASFSYARHVLTVDVRSPGVSITVLPVLYSRCWQVPAASGVKLVRANGAFLGVVTKGDASVAVDFTLSMWKPSCRHLDMYDWRADILSLTPEKKITAPVAAQADEMTWSQRLREVVKKSRW